MYALRQKLRITIICFLVLDGLEKQTNHMPIIPKASMHNT
jgi:hypothetical protein